MFALEMIDIVFNPVIRLRNASRKTPSPWSEPIQLWVGRRLIRCKGCEEIRHQLRNRNTPRRRLTLGGGHQVFRNMER